MTNKIVLAGVIGSPIAHSKSPQIHRHWLKCYGVNGDYIPMEVSAADLPEVLSALPKAGFVGVNITIPHKEIVLNIADIVTDRAALIGAANTLIFRKDGKIHADNTDGYGFLENLKLGAPNWDPTAGPATVLGAGGAARAVISSLLDAGVSEIFLANRTKTRAEKLAEDFGKKHTYTSVRLDTFSQDKKNQHLYESRGYTKLGQIFFPKQSAQPFYCYELVFRKR